MPQVFCLGLTLQRAWNSQPSASSIYYSSALLLRRTQALGDQEIIPINMKSYLFAFLLFLLLVDQTLSASFHVPTSSTAKIFGGRGGKVLKDILQNVVEDLIKQKLSPPQPNAPPKQIKGLSHIKDYLSNYGYLQSSGPFNDSLDQETKAAITTYQQYFNLQATGDLNNQTLQKILQQRCAIPDMNFTYGFTDNVSLPKAGNQWFPKGNLTYGFLPASEIPANMTKVFRGAFTQWAQATGVLNLTETTYDNADIKVGFYNFTYLEIDEEVDGGSVILLQPDSNVKTAGVILLDGTKLPSENGSLSWQDGVLDLETVAMHQIGHLLGLDHSNEEESVMYPYILPSQQRKVQLSDSDKENIQRQYTNGNSGHGGRRGVLLISTLSLGFAYVLLLY